MELWVAEYSASQDAFNTETLKTVIEINDELVVKKQNLDYQIFCLCKNQEAANAACDVMRDMQKK